MDPTNRKFQRLKLSNEKIKRAIADCEQSQFLLEMLGFQKARLPVEGMSASGSLLSAQGPEEDYYVLMEDRIDIREFETVMSVITSL
jgi:PUB domain